LPGSGRIGMTRVADAIRQRVAASVVEIDASMGTTVTIGAVHTTESKLVDIDDLLLAARVNLDSARAAGGNRTNWSDWADQSLHR
jgi:GGDEF domain-containing protein